MPVNQILISQPGSANYTPTYYESATTNWPGDVNDAYNNAFDHGLGGLPKIVRAVWVCTVTHASSGYNVGDELDADTIVVVDNAQSFSVPALAIWANTTQIGFNCSQIEDSASFFIIHKTVGDIVTLSSGVLHTFKVKLYAFR